MYDALAASGIAVHLAVVVDGVGQAAAHRAAQAAAGVRVPMLGLYKVWSHFASWDIGGSEY